MFQFENYWVDYLDKSDKQIKEYESKYAQNKWSIRNQWTLSGLRRFNYSPVHLSVGFSID